MIIAEIGAQMVRIENGVLSCNIPLLTDRGVVGSSMAFKLAEHPELDALLPMIDEAVRKVLAKSVGIAPAPGALTKKDIKS